MDGGVPVERRHEYARAYIALGMLDWAGAELHALPEGEMESAQTLGICIDLEMERKDWPFVIEMSKKYVSLRPKDEKGWISWAYSLRELQRIEEAREVLLRAEPLHGAKSALLHYNLACYACLLGDKVEARRRLDTAIRLDESFTEAAREDPDLTGLFK